MRGDCLDFFSNPNDFSSALTEFMGLIPFANLKTEGKKSLINCTQKVTNFYSD